MMFCYLIHSIAYSIIVHFHYRYMSIFIIDIYIYIYFYYIYIIYIYIKSVPLNIPESSLRSQIII